jgi:predicted RNA-binding Zn ribbon-like protein
VTVSNPRWRFVGRLCLDFAMTGGRGEWAHHERLNAADDLGDWCAQGPLQLRDVPVGDDQLRRARDLRDAIQRVAFALLAGAKPAVEHIAVLNTFAATPPLARTLDPKSLTLSIITPTCIEALLSELARDALDLAADPQARGRVRQCASPDCALVFFDDSRPGKRRWCSAGRCGDRARARAYRARKAGRRHTLPDDNLNEGNPP